MTPGRPDIRLAVRRADHIAGNRHLLSGVDLEIAPGSLWAVVGPSGSGKSTLLRLLVGLRSPSHGDSIVDGIPWGSLSSTMRIHHRRRIGLVQQDIGLLDRDVLSNVALPLLLRGIDPALAHARAQEQLDTLAAGHLTTSPVRSLSGGERQRVALARALSSNPEALVLDEFTNHQDPLTEDLMEDTVRACHRAGTAVIVVCHSWGQVQRLAENGAQPMQLALMLEGRLWTATLRDLSPLLELERPRAFLQRLSRGTVT